jgi:hypothetical protein
MENAMMIAILFVTLATIFIVAEPLAQRKSRHNKDKDKDPRDLLKD